MRESFENEPEREAQSEAIDPAEYTFPFGKYKNTTYVAVKEFDPYYIQWCDDSLNWFTLPKAERDDIDALCDSVTKRYLDKR